MSHPPTRYQPGFESFDSSTRRRRHNHVDFEGEERSANRKYETDSPALVNFTNRRLNPSTLKSPRNRQHPAPVPSVAAPSSSSSSFIQSIASPPSFPNLSTLIAEPANQLWSAAQSSINSLADHYNNSAELLLEQDCEEHTAREETEELSSMPQPPRIVVMPFSDKTSEFRTISKSCRLRVQANGHPPGGEERNNLLNSSIQFNQLARRIGRDISLSCGKLERLTELAKKRSLFDDRPGEVEELSMSIKQDISGLTRQISHLQQMARERTAGSAGSQTEHSKNVVHGLTSKLATMGKTFQQMLELRTQNQKINKSRREQFSRAAPIPTGLPPPSAGSTEMNGLAPGGSLLLYDDAVANGSTSVDMDQLQHYRSQDQMLLGNESDTYHRDRYSAMENIESSISDLGNMFRQLASLVSEQGELITRIDSNVEETSMNVEGAHHELLRYFNNISRNRWLMIKVFGVLAAFFIFFVVFMT